MITNVVKLGEDPDHNSGWAVSWSQASWWLFHAHG